MFANGFELVVMEINTETGEIVASHEIPADNLSVDPYSLISTLSHGIGYDYIL